MPLIIIEGVDGSGKTTLAEEIIAQWGYPDNTMLLHKSQPKPHGIMLQYEDELLHAYDPTDFTRLVVCDRWHLGELIYGPLYRGVSRLDGGQTRHIEMLLDSLGAIRLVLATSLNVIKARLKERGEDFLQPQDLATVHDQFIRVGRRYMWPIRDEPPTISHLIASAQHKQQALMDINLLKNCTYIGTSSPSYVIVTTQSPTSIPMQPGERATAEKAFMSTMDVHNLPRSVGILAVRDTDTLRRAMRALNKPRVITIDKDARAMCDLLGVQVASKHDTIAGLLHKENDERI